MSLEELIDEQRKAQREFHECDYDDEGAYIDNLTNANDAILSFVLDHADELIAWERAHAARTSFDDYEIGT